MALSLHRTGCFPYAYVGLIAAILAGCSSSPNPTTTRPSDAAVDGSSDGSSQLQAISVARSSQAHDDNPVIADAEYQAVVGATNQFGFDLFQKIAPSETGNIVTSATSTVFALAMTYLGARGNTQTQMAATLHDTFTAGVYHLGLNRLSLDLAQRNIAPHATVYGDQSVTLSLVDAIWAQRDFALSASYLDGLAVNYNAGVELLDFIRDAEGSRITINQWVADKTANRILDLLPQGSINDATRLVLTNALYFKGSWAAPFDAVRTSNSAFTRLDSTSVAVPTMHDGRTCLYAEGSNYQMVDMPFDGNSLSMTFVLPAQGQFTTLRDGLNQSWLAQGVAAFANAEVQLAVPKFRFTWGTKDFTQSLTALGMLDAFSPSLADFSGIEPTRQLSVAAVLHKAFIAVDESGAEAAAATAVAMAGSAAPTNIKVFTIDRPFLFMIRDTSGVVLFAGQVLDPSL